MKEEAELYHTELIEKICELDDDLMMQYLEGEEPSVDDLKPTAAAISPEYTTSNSSRLLACICNSGIHGIPRTSYRRSDRT